MKTFGRQIQAAAKKLGMTQAEFAQRAKMNKSRIPTLYRSPSITETTLKRCVKALGLELRVEFIEREQQKTA